MNCTVTLSSLTCCGMLVGTLVAGPSVPQSQRVDQKLDVRAHAWQDLLSNPVGPALLQSVAPELWDELIPAAQNTRACAIFAPDTPEWYISNRLQRIEYPFEDGTRFQLSTSQWGSGDSVTLFYSFPPDGTELGGEPEQENTNFMHERWSAPEAFGSEAAWKTLFAQAFDSWSQITGNTYIEIADDGAGWPNSKGPFDDPSQNPGNPASFKRGDIRIVSSVDDGLSGVLGFNFFPSSGGDMHLDSADLIPNFFGNSNNNFRLLRNVIVHEHGHGLGIRHECPANGHAIMQPFITTAFDGARLDDRLAGYAKHGDRFEPNDTFGNEIDLDAEGLSPGSEFVIDRLAANSGDEDLFEFTVSQLSTLDITIIPQGSTYNSGPQLSSGFCSSGTPFDALSQANLAFTLFDASLSVVVTINDNAAGFTESRSNINLATTGTHTLKVFSSFANSQQEYQLRLLLNAGQIIGDINDDGFVNGTDLLFLLAQWGPGTENADLNEDGFVDGIDLLLLLGNWTG